jgi:thiol-disulfide isomerase/thioredoxin
MRGIIIMTKVQKLIASLPALDGLEYIKGQGYVMAKVKPHAFERDGHLFVSTEAGDFAADYYGEYCGGCPWINEELEAWAKKAGGYWEWQNPAAIVFINN